MSIVFWSNRITKKIIWNLQRNKKIPLHPPIPRMITIAESCPVLHLTIEPENYQLLRLFLTLVFFIEKKVKLYEMKLKYRENGSWEKSSVLFFQMSGPSSSPDSPYLDWGNAFSLFSGGVPRSDSASVLDRIL